MRFVETHVFTELVCELLTDDEYRALQLALLLRPEQGPVIPGSGGLRKVRWGGQGRGKRGAFRVIYHWSPSRSVCYMLFMYRKNQQGDLTPAQVKILSRIVKEEFS